MKPLNTSTYTFSELIGKGSVHVDKSAMIHALLVQDVAKQFFLSRPRRFGKSLLVSTLKAIFQGRRKLFDGLAIAGANYDWQLYPVIHLDLGSCRSPSPEELERSLPRIVRYAAEDNGCPIETANCYDAFQDLIKALASRDGKVVVLVDEYDKPLLGHLGAESAADIQKVLKSFYSVIKTTEGKQRFALLTGVSKFSKVSVFSDLNNLVDLTMELPAATLLGYTQTELEHYFAEHIDAFAAKLGKSREEALEELKEWYNGYKFHPEAESVYNPVSAMSCLRSKEFRNYWFETGTPNFLVDLLRRQPVSLDKPCVPDAAFSTYDPRNLDPLTLLVQTGYLTIKGCEPDGRRRRYRLGFSNFEIEESFSLWLAEGFCWQPKYELEGASTACGRACWRAIST